MSFFTFKFDLLYKTLEITEDQLIPLTPEGKGRKNLCSVSQKKS